jgi:sphingomyelin phosphodiesterase 2
MDIGGKRLDYIFYRQPEIAKRRPLIWGRRDGQDGDGDQMEEGKPMDKSLDRAPILRCINSEVVLTGLIPGGNVSYSDHFGLSSTFTVDTPERQQSREGGSGSNGSGRSFSPLLDQNNPNTSVSSLPNSSISPENRSNRNNSEKSKTIRTALHTLRLYTRISQTTAKYHLRLFAGAIVALLALTIGSAWQPKSWLQPIFTLLGGAIGAGGATMLYFGFVWGRWELGLLTEVTEEMELELRVSEMEESGE